VHLRELVASAERSAVRGVEAPPPDTTRVERVRRGGAWCSGDLKSSPADEDVALGNRLGW
jgi:hypothetical protein